VKTSLIRFRVADFLKQYPPFDGLPEPDLFELAGTGRVSFHEADEYVFRRGRPRKPSVGSRTNMPGAAPVSEPMTLTDVAVEVSERPVRCSARRTSTSPTTPSTAATSAARKLPCSRRPVLPNE